jgi:hypothetical protein
VRSVDDQELGVGEVTLQLQQAYWDLVRGKNERYTDWLDFVPVRDASRISTTRS